MIDKQTLLSNSDDVIVTPSKNPESVTTNTSSLSSKPTSPKPSQSRKLTGKQKAFIKEVIENPTKPVYQAVKKVYNVQNDNVARSIGSENLTKPNIMQALDVYSDRAIHGLQEIADYSKEYGKELKNKDGASYAMTAVTVYKDTLDRIHGKARQITEVQSTAVSISIDMSTQHTTEVE